MFRLAEQPWCSRQILSINRLPARAFFLTSTTEEKALKGISDRAVSLNGSWDFHYTEQTPLDEEAFVREAGCLPWDTIRVPRSWQMAGFGKALYTDEDYPFPMQPPLVPARNPTGVYRRFFDLDEVSGELILRLDGAESCASVYVNGCFAGYTQGSRLPAEFLITPMARKGSNELLIIVREYCDGTYLEDQDMWWLGGIIRDVRLLFRPEKRLEDVILKADWDPETNTGSLTVETVGPEATWKLLDRDGAVLAAGVSGEKRSGLPVRPWNAEEPVLYRLLVSVPGETALFRVGFRRILIRDGVLLLNGKRFMMRGVNRHEFSPVNGRAVSPEEMSADLTLMKKAHINAIRTSHYPNDPRFYDLCDELGFYVIDECDLETHGFEIQGTPARLADDPAWEDAYTDRALRTVSRDRNHACVLLWSLGNESFRGRNFTPMYRLIHQLDSRPVHYEGDISYACSDVISSMYTRPGLLAERDAACPAKPMILCEFAHAMGNGPGGLAEYREVIEKSGHIQGYFIWEWRNHGILRDGRYLHGGDTGTAYHSGNFCMDGLLNSDSTPTPGFYSYAHMNEPLRVSLENGQLMIRSVLDFRTVSGASAALSLIREDQPVRQTNLPLPLIAPGETVCLTPDPEMLRAEKNALYLLSVVIVENDEILGFDRFMLKDYQPVPAAPETALWRREGDRFVFDAGGCGACVSLADGRIHDYRVHGKEVMPLGPMIGFWRPATDNDRHRRSRWNDIHLHAMTPLIESAELDGPALILTGRMGAGARLWSAPFRLQYTPLSSGALRVTLDCRFEGPYGTEREDDLPRIGTDSVLRPDLSQFRYLGFGPGETYPDSRFQARYGWYRSSVRDLSFRYDCPQETGNRTGCHAAALTDSEGTGLAFVSRAAFDTAASFFDPADIEAAAHPDELRERDRIFFRLDAKTAGLGSASCGPDVFDAYRVRCLPWSMDFLILPLSGGDEKLTGIVRKGWDELC